MEDNKIQSFMMAHGSKFDAMQNQIIVDRLRALPDERFYNLFSLDLYDPVIMLLISFFVGTFGIDRFMLGQTGLGIAKLLTCGGLGIWYIVDLFLIMGETRRYNLQQTMMLTA